MYISYNIKKLFNNFKLLASVLFLTLILMSMFMKLSNKIINKAYAAACTFVKKNH